MPINFSNVYYTYGLKSPNEYQALDNINFFLPNRFFCAVVGHTGSGKSTLIQHLNGLLLPTKGIIFVDDFMIEAGKKKQKRIRDLRKHVGVVFQFPEYQLFEETVEKDVMFGPKNFKIKDEEARKIARESLLAVGLDESYFNKSPFELSGGEKRRVAIAGILALKPEILVLDEPTAGLDPLGAKEVLTLFKKLHELGTNIIIVTHDMDIVLKYCDHVIVLNDGKIVKKTSPFLLFKDNIEEYSLEIPPQYHFINYLSKHGYDFDMKNGLSIDQLVDAIKRGREK